MTREALSKLPPAPELVDYFGGSESAVGLSSSHESLVAIAFGGASARDPDRRMVALVDRRRRGGIDHSTVRAALLSVAPSYVLVLSAAYGPEDWKAIADQAFGRGTGTKLVRALGALLGVALLTRTVVEGHELAERERLEALEARAEPKRTTRIHGREATTDAWNLYPPTKRATRTTLAHQTPGGWLLRAVESRNGAFARVVDECNELFRRSFDAWRDAQRREGLARRRGGGKDALSRSTPRPRVLRGYEALHEAPAGFSFGLPDSF